MFLSSNSSSWTLYYYFYVNLENYSWKYPQKCIPKKKKDTIDSVNLKLNKNKTTFILKNVT